MEKYSGASLEEAISAAAEDKGVSESEVRYNVVTDPEQEGVTIEAFTMDDVKEFLFDYLGNYFTSIDLDIEVAIEERRDGLTVNLNAENNAVLIGKMGKTITAFNTVTKAAVTAQFHQHLDILIDVNHYKEQRYRKLRFMAKKTARNVQRSHVDAELDPMPNDERKVIHNVLNDWHNIRTESEGTGAARHVCIRYVADQNEDQTEEENPVEAEESSEE